MLQPFLMLLSLMIGMAELRPGVSPEKDAARADVQRSAQPAHNDAEFLQQAGQAAEAEIAWAALALLRAAHAHEVPSDVTVRLLVRPDGDRAVVLVRAPLEAMQDIVFPTFGPGYLDVPNAAPQLRSAAQVWLLDNLELYEGERRVPLSIVGVRASLPSDRAFAGFDTALAHFDAAPLAAGPPERRSSLKSG